jgi:hypothetical protein
MKPSRVDDFMVNVDSWREMESSRVKFVDEPEVHHYSNANSNNANSNNANSNNERVYSSGNLISNPGVLEPKGYYARYGSDNESDGEQDSDLTDKIDAVYNKLCTVDQNIRNIVDGVSANTEIMSAQINALMKDQETIMADQKAITGMLAEILAVLKKDPK